MNNSFTKLVNQLPNVFISRKRVTKSYISPVIVSKGKNSQMRK